MKRLSPPFFVTLFALSVLILAIHNALRFVAAIASWQTLQTYASASIAFFIAASGFVWAVVWATLFIKVWRGIPKARAASFVTIFLYSFYNWVNRSYLQSTPPYVSPYLLGGYLLWLLIAMLALSLPGSKKFFAERENHDR
jgi:hypothetical protein